MILFNYGLFRLVSSAFFSWRVETETRTVVILAMTQLLAYIFKTIKQPRVIAEVIGGVFLGPTVMGRIPGFRNAIFPG
jgi:Kef-type K+ transport system membrane component KefB